ncbi:hypothetical protein PA10_00141 [Pseudomonas phage pPa_SNUABM_DT01]|nr:hypothetical protein PA10_00141 [Pseudomonas phage pPa_SNUABM_DT01]
MISEYVGKTVRFNTLAPNVLGANRDNVIVKAVLDLDTARLLSDVRSKHAQVKPYIANLPEAAGSYSYVKLVHGNGQSEVLGVPWVDSSTIEIISDRKLVVTIDKVSDSTEQLVREALLQNGVSNFKIDYAGTVAS